MPLPMSRPAFRYYGSKYRMVAWIINFFPSHACYVEPYGGSAAVLLNKPRSRLEVYNDASEDVVNFFTVLREREDDLVRAIKLTPYARQEWRAAMESHADPDPLERARLFYIRAFMNRAGATAKWSSGWRRRVKFGADESKKEWVPVSRVFTRTRHLHEIAGRLRGVQIECDDAISILTDYDSPVTLFYLDPPYPQDTRGRWSKSTYAHEMTDDEHRELAKVVHGLEGMVVISSYPGLYDELYSDWECARKEFRTENNVNALECLWLSPTVEANRLPLFRELEQGSLAP